jgi:membrane-associated phospholipid phosphatase
MRLWVLSVMLLTLLAIVRGSAQTDSQPPTPAPDAKTESQDSSIPLTQGARPPKNQPTFLPLGEDPENRLVTPFMKHLALDQKQFWTAPFHLRWSDAEVLAPFAAFTGALMANDAAISRQVPGTTSQINRSKSISDYATYSFIGVAGASYFWGHFIHDDHLRETGFLAGEAALNSTAVAYLFKAMTQRPRPLDGNGNGTFFQGGTSFPSEHSAIAWSVASVVAHEYPGTLTKIAAYGLASAVTLTRVTGKQHFPSDVVVGSALGWYFARQVYRAHHDPELGGAAWGNFQEDSDSDNGEKVRNPQHMGSTYVPLDSWVYPAVDKLASLGYIRTAFLASKPWTRIETANLVNEAKGNLEVDENAPEGIAALELQLEQEFAYELGLLDGKSNETAKVESIYTRVVSISGPPLNDSYHFGQTIINNFGRPFEQGFNTYDGFSGYGAAGPFTIYVRGEYQHAPSAPGYSLAARQAIAAADQNPLQPEVPFAGVGQFTLLDTYAAAKVDGWNLSFGKQSLWWGPGEGGALVFSDNAEPIYMFRASQTPFELPWIFRRLGPVKLDLFFGKLSGNEFPARPLIHGEKISFKPTPNWEVGFERTSEFGGVGRALTLGAIWESYVATKTSFDYPTGRNPGKRTIGLDFSYRLPHLRDWVTLYADALLPESNPFNVDTSQNPLDFPARTALRPGIYMPRLPRLPKLDFRAEFVYTDTPTPRSIRGDYVYWDAFYRDLYTNKNNLIGDWIGREGMGFQAWSTYWFGARSSLQTEYRHAKVAKDFIPGGETLNDGSVKVNWWVRRDLSLSGSVQYEKWLAPILAPTVQTNWTSTVEVTFWPKSWGR